MFGSTRDLGFDARARQRVAQHAYRRRDEALAIALAFVDEAHDAAVRVRLKVAECEVFEFPLQLPDAETVRERRVQVDRELRELAALLCG